MGLRERKKTKTRKVISDTATKLFIDRGYENVTTAEIAERAEVSVPTLFKYFPTKESLVFDEDGEMENALIGTVVNRKKGQTIRDALLEAGIAHIDSIQQHDKKNFSLFMALVDRTPELSLYAKQMWMRHEIALAGVIQKEAKNKMSSLHTRAIARFVLDSYHRAVGESHPKAALRSLFEILRSGWND